MRSWEFLKYRFILNRLLRQRSNYVAKRDKEITKAKKSGKNWEDLQKIYDEWSPDINWNQEEIDLLQTRHLLYLAEILLVPMPEYGKKELWQEATIGPGSYLRPTAFAQLRSDIRKEDKERSEIFRAWTGTLIGLIGATIGLVTVLLKFL